MKATLSLAVLCLLGEVSAENLSKHHRQQNHSRWEADYKGNYAQSATRHHHKHGKHHHHEHSSVQMKDHRNDSDDIVEDGKMVQLGDHENDTEDMPAGLDPFQLMQLNLVSEQKKTAQKWEDEYNQKEEEDSFEFVQTKYDHEGDTEDMPAGLDPIDLAQAGQHKSSFQLAEEEQQMEVQAIINDSGEDLVQLNQQNMDYGIHKHSFNFNEEDEQNIQLKDYGVVQHGFAAEPEDSQDVYLSYESHAADTDDIAEDLTPDMYDHHHSKMWNDLVSKKALELEQTMKIEDNIEDSKVKAKDEAERRASIVKFNEEQEKKKFNAQQNKKKNEHGSLAEQRKVNPYQTIDLSEVYSAMV